MKDLNLRSMTLLLAVALAPASVLGAATETILYSFSGGTEPDGALPIAGLVLGPDGSLYGTTTEGGGTTCNCGTVFRLVPPAVGQTTWTHTVLHRFQGYPNDGGVPYANLIFDGQGNLYGTTLLGGSQEYGSVFVLTPPASGGAWAERVLHNFAGPPADGAFPQAGVTFDAAGSLYGTASLGGTGDQGALFKLTPSGSTWNLTVLHTFAGGADGAQPHGGVIFDAQGNLYGTTAQDGISGIAGGTAFRFASDGTETVLHTFTDRDIGTPFDGGIPSGALLFDAAGNLYGTTEIGGGGQVVPGEASNAGTVYRLAPPSQGQSAWTETLLHSFDGNATDGGTPVGGVVADSNGNLYGVTNSGGTLEGTAFRLTKSAGSGAWRETVLHNFTGSGDGAGPQGGLVSDEHGNFYGVTMNGSASSVTRQVGTVFRLTP